MYKLLTLNKIAECGLEYFDKSKYTISENEENPDCIILRSFNMNDMELPKSLMAVARAGAGVNNIPVAKCAELGIPVFNTPGANANAVKELTVLGMLLSCRKVVDGVNWAQSLKGTEGVAKAVEKGKSAFIGPELEGKKLAVIGLGAIGVMVANAAYALGMDIIGYDPYISVKAALGLTRHASIAADFKSALADADFITLHLPLAEQTKGMFNDELFSSSVKKGARLLNFSRGELVDNGAVKAALKNGVLSAYVTDFPCEELLGVENVIATPHLGASTPEAEDNCAIMAAKELTDYMENGNIANAVNFPNCELPRTAQSRVTILHKNVPNMITQFSGLLAADGFNIDNLINKSSREYAYTIMEIDGDVSGECADKLLQIDGVVRARIIK